MHASGHLCHVVADMHPSSECALKRLQRDCMKGSSMTLLMIFSMMHMQA